MNPWLIIFALATACSAVGLVRIRVTGGDCWRGQSRRRPR
jgi:hypothetical protein